DDRDDTRWAAGGDAAGRSITLVSGQHAACQTNVVVAGEDRSTRVVFGDASSDGHVGERHVANDRGSDEDVEDAEFAGRRRSGNGDVGRTGALEIHVLGEI